MQQRGGDVFDVFEAGIGTDGLGLLAGNFKAVVLGGVVAGGHLYAAAGPQMIDCEIHLRRIDQADVDDIGAGSVHPLDQGSRQRGAVRAHVPADNDALGIGQPAIVAVYHRPQELGRGMADLPGGLLVKLLLIEPPNIIRLKN